MYGSYEIEKLFFMRIFKFVKNFRKLELDFGGSVRNKLKYY